MPKLSPQVFHCQQADDFTVVSTTSAEANKENFAQSRNYQTLSQTIAAERLQLLRAIELEHSIFTLSFHLIETFFRPTCNPPSSSSSTEGVKSLSVQNKRKRRGKIVTEDKVPTEIQHAHGAFQMPRKRIHGLEKAFTKEYSAKMSLPGISKHFAAFYHDLVDWQLVFAVATDSPSNYDSLFDYEDAIATTANLLAIARQHSDLIDGLVLCADREGKSVSAEYVRDQNNYGGSSEFRKLINLVEQLVEHKKDRLKKLRQKADDDENGNSGHLLAGWFKCDKPDAGQVDSDTSQTTDHQKVKDLQREVSAWEELIDVVEISAK